MGTTPGPSILLVEDNEDIREGLSTLLDSEGYTVTAVSTAEEGLARLEAQRFHLVITDYMLPGEHGGWMVEQAAQRGRLSGARVMMITAHPRVVAPRGVRILHKPLEIHVFLTAVEEELAAALQHEARAG